MSKHTIKVETPSGAMLEIAFAFHPAFRGSMIDPPEPAYVEFDGVKMPRTPGDVPRHLRAWAEAWFSRHEDVALTIAVGQRSEARERAAEDRADVAARCHDRGLLPHEGNLRMQAQAPMRRPPDVAEAARQMIAIRATPAASRAQGGDNAG